MNEGFSIKKYETPRARAQRALELLKKGIPQDVDPRGVIAYHGTSIEALQHAVMHGTFVGTQPGDRMYPPGDLFAAPLLHRIPSTHAPSHWFSRVMQHESGDEIEKREDAILYAKLIAQRHWLMEALGFELDNTIAEKAVRDILSEDSLPELWSMPSEEPESQNILRILIKKHGYTKLEELKDRALMHEGILVALSRSALNEAGVGMGDTGAGDIRFIPGARGLSFDHVAGLQIFGKQEGEALYAFLCAV